MRLYFLLFVLIITSTLSFAQERYNNEEFGFSFDLPEGWVVSTPKKDSYRSNFKTVLLCNPKGAKPFTTYFTFFWVEIAKVEIVSGTEIDSSIFEDLIKKEELFALINSDIEYIPVDRGKKFIKRINPFYEKINDRSAIAACVFKTRYDVEYVIARARFADENKVLSIRGYWKGNDDIELWDIFNDLINSLQIDHDKVPEGLTKAISLGRPPPQQTSTHSNSESSKETSDSIQTSLEPSDNRTMGEKVTEFMTTALIFAVCLWCGMKFTGEEGSFWVLVLISVVASLVALIPYAGWILSSIVMIAMLSKMLAIEAFPDALLIVVVAQIVGHLVTFGIIGMLMNK